MHIAVFIEKNHGWAVRSNRKSFRGGTNMKLRRNVQIITATAVLALAMGAAHAHHNPGHGGGGGGGPGPGPNDPVFTVESLSPYIPAVDSHSLDGGGQIVFYDALMDLSPFDGTLESGENCSHGEQIGTLVIHRESRKNPLVAELVFWFQGVLESGDLATHSFVMQGWFDEPDNWPPTEADIETTVTFENWQFEAENRPAQRQDCAGAYDYSGVGPWTVTVTLLQ
jgi:hypothetical protein